LRGEERKAAADKVSTALIECIGTLIMLDAFRGEPPEGFERVEVPFADNVQRAVEAIGPLRPLLAQLLYDLPAAEEGDRSPDE
jgi:hypothetical protein